METVLFLGLGFLTTGAFAMRFPSLSSYPVIFSEHELDKAEERLHRKYISNKTSTSAS